MPLIVSEPDALARVYARSLFELARQAGGQARIEEVVSELEQVLELARSDARFAEFLSSRILPSKKRSQSLQRIFTGAVSDLSLKFLQVLNMKDRLAHLAPIVAALDQMMQREFGRVEVDVYTAAPASADELNSIRARLQSILGKEPVLHSYTEPSMIGGLKLQIGDQLVDASLAANLRRLRDQLSSEGSAKIRAKFDRFFEG